MDREAWRATVCRVEDNQTQLKRLSMHTGEESKVDMFSHTRSFIYN